MIHDEIRENILNDYNSIIKDMKDVYIFGTKKLGLKTLNCLKSIGIEPIGFIDNNKKIQGHYLKGKRIYSLKEIDEKSQPIIIVASIMYMNEISDQLKKEKFYKVIPYPILTLWDEKKFPAQFTLINIQGDLVKNEIEYINLYYDLQDEESKYILNNIIKFRATLNFKYMDLCYDEKNIQYFDIDILKLNENEIFVDGGAFDGDSAMNFIEQSNYKYKKLYLFEPNKSLLEEAKKNLRQYKNVIYSSYGLYSEKKILKFTDTGGLDGRISEDGNVKVNAVSLDDFIHENISFLKLDIEGGEIEAIKGAARHIRNNKPKLAIAVYHNSSDIWSIPKLINSINTSYRFYLRHYTRNVADTVLYCI